MEWSRLVVEMSLKEIEAILVAEAAIILSTDPEAVAVATPFERLGMTSMGFVELLVVIEESFDLKLMETDLRREDFQTIGSLALRISQMK